MEIRMTDGKLGDTDGTFKKISYFKVNKKAGAFVELHDVIKTYTAQELLEMVTCIAFFSFFYNLRLFIDCIVYPSLFFNQRRCESTKSKK